jgi:hypothetical protein
MQRISKKASLVTAALFLFSGFFILSGTVSAMTVTPATGGGAVSADTNTTNGIDPTWTLLTGPTIAESGNRELTLTANRTIVFSAPAGFEFNTGNLVTATITRLAGAGTCFTFVSRNVTPTANDITYTINSRDTNDGSTICQVSFSNIQIKPSAGTPLTSGKITNTGTNTSVPRGAATSYGNLAEIAGAVSASISTISASTPPISTDGGTATITVTAKDLYGNPLSGIASTDVVLGVNPTAGTALIQPFSATNASGQTFGMLQSTAAGTKTITATISSILLTHSATEIFGPGVPTTGNIVAAPGATVEANLGGTTVTLTVTITDGHGNLAADNTVVNLQSDLGTIGGSGNTINGIVTRTLTYNNKGVAHLSFNGGGLTATGDTVITFQDTTLPVIAPSSDILGVEATSSGGAAITYTSPAAFDNIDGAIPVNCIPASGSTFPLGNNTVTCSATDSSSNTQTSTFTVQVVDTTAPVISGTPSDMTVEATSPAGAVATYTDPTATDLVDGPVTPVCVPASGSTFPIATTLVTCTATDVHSNTSVSTFNIIVQDTTSPIASITFPNSGDHLQGTITITANASDSGSGVQKVEFYHSSISPTLIGDDTTAPYSFDWDTTGVLDGSHSIYVQAFDNAGNPSGYVSIPVIVDNLGPVIAAHGTVTEEATSAAGALVAYTDPTATDAVDGATSVVCLPASGSQFPLGDTTITCTSADVPGHISTSTFTVTVQDTTAPTIIGTPTDITVEATSPAGAVATYVLPTATDLVDGTDAVTCAPVSGSLFIVGTTPVTCNSADAAGNNATPTTFNVIIQDTIAPVISFITSDATAAGVLKIGDTITFTLTPSGNEAGAKVNGSYNGQTLAWATSDGGNTYTATYTVTGGDPDQSSALQITGVTMNDEGGNTSAPADGSDVLKTIDANVPEIGRAHV